mmetsp:Transcript_90946/g.294337  ORF Transcript_90946/g.294337 Transcript_90946/m.294337 type:complete len:695 (-) Transcript_90946:96-2180(-)
MNTLVVFLLLSTRFQLLLAVRSDAAALAVLEDREVHDSAGNATDLAAEDPQPPKPDEWAAATAFTDKAVGLGNNIAAVAKDPTLKNTGGLIASMGALAIVTVPPPAGLVISGVLSLVGGVMSVYGAGPSDEAKLINALQSSIEGQFDKIHTALDKLQSTMNAVLHNVEKIYTHLRDKEMTDIDAIFHEGLQKVERAKHEHNEATRASMMENMKEWIISAKKRMVHYVDHAEMFAPSNLKSTLEWAVTQSTGSPWAAVMASRVFLARRAKLWYIMMSGSIYQYGGVSSESHDFTEEFKKQLDEYKKVFATGIEFEDAVGKYHKALEKPIKVSFTDLLQFTDNSLTQCIRNESSFLADVKALATSSCLVRDVRAVLKHKALPHLRDKCGSFGKDLVKSLTESKVLTPEFKKPFELFYGMNRLYYLTECKPRKSTQLPGFWGTDQDRIVNLQPGQGVLLFNLHVIMQNILRHVTVANQDGAVWSSNWQDMALNFPHRAQLVYDGHNGAFAITRGRLYHVSGSCGSCTEHWSSWMHLDGMAWDGKDGVFVVSRSNLYHFSPQHKNGVFWSEGWHPAGKMVTGYNGGLYIISNGELHHASEKGKGHGIGELWCRGWDESSRMAWDGDDGAFIVSKGKLYHVSPRFKWPKESDAWSSGWQMISFMHHDYNGGVFIWSAPPGLAAAPIYRAWKGGWEAWPA